MNKTLFSLSFSMLLTTCGLFSMDWNEIFLKAIKSANVNEVRNLLATGMPINFLDEDGATPLFNAAAHGREAVVRLLLDRGALVNLGIAGIWTPLHVASFNSWDPYGGRRCFRIVRLLIGAGANIDATGAYPGLGDYALRTPADVVNPEYVQQRILQQLFPSDISRLNEVRDYLQRRARPSQDLLKGVEMERIDMIRRALKNHADINIQNRHGNTPLMIAVIKKNRDMIKYLLQFAQSINFGLQNNQGQTVIDLFTYAPYILGLIQQATVKK